MLIPLGILDFPVAAGSYDLLETEILTSSQSSVTFSSLGDYSDYQHLQIRGTHRDTRTGSTGNIAWMRFNADTGANYSFHQLFGNGSTVSSSAGASQVYGWFGLSSTATSTANNFASSVCDILDPFETTKYTTSRSLTGNEGNSIRLWSSSWRNTAALTSIQILSDGHSFVTGSRFSLYGWKVA